MPRPPRELIDFLYRYEPAVQSLALALRALILSEIAPAHEYIFRMRSKLMMMYGPTDKVIKDNVCAAALYRKHVTLGLRRGRDLKDPAGLLDGTRVKSQPPPQRRTSAWPRLF